MGTGFVSKEIIIERMPPPDKETLIFFCGPKPMNLHVKSLLLSIGYDDSMIIKF
jgi:Flavodoxin reductases (ferredoxin-NADPH reductases) family 1